MIKVGGGFEVVEEDGGGRWGKRRIENGLRYVWFYEGLKMLIKFKCWCRI